ncbi:MAG: iron ABC transporter permease, partial [Clostridia bacterium]|nr:iron ABC transporter permease [Clostridia bacterium]
MQKTDLTRENKRRIRRNKIKTFFSKPQNIILLLFGIVLTFTTIAPIVAIAEDTLAIHPGTIDENLAVTQQQYTVFYPTGSTKAYSLANYIDLFTSRLAKKNLWTPLLNTVLLAVITCFISILYGGIFAFLVTRTNLKFRKYLSSIFIFPYIMPQWTLAVVWQNLFNSHAVTGGADGLLASVFHISMPGWWCQGLFPSAVVLGLHYAPFAYILIGGIFRNM